MAVTYTFSNPYPDTTVKDLLEHHLLIPRKIRHFLRIKKNISINHSEVNWQSLVKQGDIVTLTFTNEEYPDKEILWGNASLVNCLYEDQHLIIVNKPEGMKTHGNSPEEIALVNHVSAYIKQTAYVVHRLDMETSGLIMFAKNPFILPILNRLLENKAISREYWAISNGNFTDKQTIYKDKIGRHRHDRRKRVVDSQNGQTAITIVKRLKQFKGACLVNCQLKTGRTHQIRVHLAHHQHAIIGDPLYATKPAPRLMLHAHRLSFTHPLTNENITVTAKSETFERYLKTL